MRMCSRLNNKISRRLSPEDAGNYMVNVRNKFGEKANHVRLSMKVFYNKKSTNNKDVLKCRRCSAGCQCAQQGRD